MSDFMMGFLWEFKGAFSRQAAFAWFIVVFAGFALRSDWLGATSLIRALDLSPALYPHLLHFFHASSWNGSDLLLRSFKWLAKNGLMVRRNGRLVLIGDESKVPQEGRRMPAVKTLRQTSETSSKPSYFRGHEWSFIGVLIGSLGKYFCAPAWACLTDGKPGTDVAAEKRKAGGSSRKMKKGGGPRTADIVKAASRLAFSLGIHAYLALDAFYAAGPVFMAASEAGNIFIVTRAKCNCVAHIPAARTKKSGRGRPRKYAGAVKVAGLYADEAEIFEARRAKVYGRTEVIRILARTLYWKPAKSLVLFVLVETSRGRVTLMSSDLAADPVDVLELYCHRSLIEVMFHNIKNLLGLMEYRFWSRHLEPQTRRPAKNGTPRESGNPKNTARTIAAISNYLHVGLVFLVFLQALSCKFGSAVTEKADCWLRTPSGPVPSEFVAKSAAACVLRRLLRGSGGNPMARIIQGKMKSQTGNDRVEDAA